jgi:hypothetical protein
MAAGWGSTNAPQVRKDPLDVALNDLQQFVTSAPVPVLPHSCTISKPDVVCLLSKGYHQRKTDGPGLRMFACGVSPRVSGDYGNSSCPLIHGPLSFTRCKAFSQNYVVWPRLKCHGLPLPAPPEQSTVTSATLLTSQAYSLLPENGLWLDFCHHYLLLQVWVNSELESTL